MKKKAWAHWQGSLKQGKGAIFTESGVLNNAPYGFNARFEGGPGTNPEELIGAAHAGCFTMAFAKALGNVDLVATSLETNAEVTLTEVGGRFAITAVHLKLKAVIPGVSHQVFDEIAQQTKAGCPVSKLLNALITLEATLENSTAMN